MSATDIRYGRRGGRWANHASGELLVELDELRDHHEVVGTWPQPLDVAGRSHPDTIAGARAHDRTCSGSHPEGEACPAPVDAEDLADMWVGRARMAAARRAAGVPLDDIDLEALARCAR